MMVWFATKGSGTNEARRIEKLLSESGPSIEWKFDKTRKRESFWELLKKARAERPSLIVMEGTGTAGGLVCLISKFLWRVPYVFSSGDAVGPFVGAHHPALGAIFGIYERLLCRYAAGFIGWTPYLTGRAIGFGSPRAMTAAGWSIGESRPKPEARAVLRKQLGISDETLVFGILGALEWNPSRQYCYGLELVRAIREIERCDVAVVIVGGGSGHRVLTREAAGDSRIHLPGPVPLDAVMDWLSVFDVASLPQSMDPVGMFRYTTKISEYAAAKLPVITLQTPMAYDLDAHWMWRLRGEAPWDPMFLEQLSAFMETVTPQMITAKRAYVPGTFEIFDVASQVRRTKEFIGDILATQSQQSVP